MTPEQQEAVKAEIAAAATRTKAYWQLKRCEEDLDEAHKIVEQTSAKCRALGLVWSDDSSAWEPKRD